LRRRFASSLAQYQVLVRLAHAEASQSVEAVRSAALQASSSEVPDIVPPILEQLPPLHSKTPIFQRDYINAQSIIGHSPEQKAGELYERPSAYLRSRCAACFGGAGVASSLGEMMLVRANLARLDNTNKSLLPRPDLIVCIDGNFQQKRNRDHDRREGHEGAEGARDPPIFSANTTLLSHEFLKDWEAKVNGIRSAGGTSTGKKRSRANASLDVEVDKCEDGLHVPNSALQQCGESFVAADENRAKASRTRFSDTGLMGLLCRHDHVLYIANMWTAGEKQFYALALIDALMKEVPRHWQVGLLYDIACQLHRSLIKWHYLDMWLPRLRFGTSVFHAYGHQWVCQLWYHPRKGQIWGLSDGEGCERLWASIRKLIPGLRVTGVREYTSHWSSILISR
jgi:hypothetical protein